MIAKFKVGQRVRAKHPNHVYWSGIITYSADTEEGDISWEYEVSNAPIDRGEDMPSGCRWGPLLWEDQIRSEE